MSIFLSVTFSVVGAFGDVDSFKVVNIFGSIVVTVVSEEVISEEISLLMLEDSMVSKVTFSSIVVVLSDMAGNSEDVSKFDSEDDLNIDSELDSEVDAEEIDSEVDAEEIDSEVDAEEIDSEVDSEFNSEVDSEFNSVIDSEEGEAELKFSKVVSLTVLSVKVTSVENSVLLLVVVVESDVTSGACLLRLADA